MIIEVKVNTNAKKNEIIEDKGKINALLTVKPINGKANDALIKLLADYYNVTKSQITIIKGEKSKNKIVQINLLTN